MPQRIIIIAMTATDLAQHRLHPGDTARIIGLTKQTNSYLGVLVGLRVLALFAEQHGQFKKRPGFFVTLALFAVQRETAREATQSLRVFAQLAQDRAQAKLYLPFARKITQAERIRFRAAQYDPQRRGIAASAQRARRSHNQV